MPPLPATSMPPAPVPNTGGASGTWDAPEPTTPGQVRGVEQVAPASGAEPSGREMLNTLLTAEGMDDYMQGFERLRAMKAPRTGVSMEGLGSTTAAIDTRTTLQNNMAAEQAAVLAEQQAKATKAEQARVIVEQKYQERMTKLDEYNVEIDLQMQHPQLRLDEIKQLEQQRTHGATLEERQAATNKLNEARDPINPLRMFEGNTGMKIGAIIAAGLQGFAAGWQGRPAPDTIGEIIKHDVEKQRANYNALRERKEDAKGLYATVMNRYQNDVSAYHRSMEIGFRQAAMMVDIIAQKYAPRVNTASAEITKSELLLRVKQHNAEAARHEFNSELMLIDRQMERGLAAVKQFGAAGGASPVPGLVPLGPVTDKAVTDAQTVMGYYNTAKKYAQQLVQLRKEHGSAVLDWDVQNQMEELAAGIHNAIRHMEFKTGAAISESEWEMMDKLAPRKPHKFDYHPDDLVLKTLMRLPEHIDTVVGGQVRALNFSLPAASAPSNYKDDK